MFSRSEHRFHVWIVFAVNRADKADLLPEDKFFNFLEIHSNSPFRKPGLSMFNDCFLLYYTTVKHKNKVSAAENTFRCRDSVS